MSRAAFFGVLLSVAPLLTVAQAQQLAPLPPALPRTHTPQPTTPAITASDLMTRLYIFADDSMMGRAVGSRGNAKGTTYIAAEVRRMGLQPAGDSGTYFQNLPGYPSVVTEASMRLGNSSLALAQDFLPIGPHGLTNRALTVVYGGRSDAPGSLSAQQAAGKLVVFTVPTTTSVDSLLPIPQVAGAAAVALVALDAITPVTRARILNRNLALQQQPASPVILLNTATAKRLFGKEVGALSVGTVGQPVAIAYTIAYSARNIVAILPGSDPALRHEYIAMGAHNDHIGWRLVSIGDHDSLRAFTHYASIEGARTGGNEVTPTPEQMDSINAAIARLRRINPPRRDSIFNGADDDGSGTVSLLEIAEHLAAMPVKPKRSILFVWHTGEEAGLLGSQWFTDHPTVPLDSIVTQLNIDMIGRGNASDIPDGNPDYLFAVGSRMMSTELGDLIERVNIEDHHGLAIHNTEDGYRNSDHYMYAQHGIPITFFKTGRHSDYHQVTDEPQYIDYKKMARIASFLGDVAVHVADLDHRLVVDHPNGQ
ncbi:MAG TPA: M28 family peptidase [Gemmatimonadaceae bacterium]|jgi:hypothetical protein|nr:M28 family peptidase [Gemmatimonadaceae bacterium]